MVVTFDKAGGVVGAEVQVGGCWGGKGRRCIFSSGVNCL